MVLEDAEMMTPEPAKPPKGAAAPPPSIELELSRRAELGRPEPTRGDMAEVERSGAAPSCLVANGEEGSNSPGAAKPSMSASIASA